MDAIEGLVEALASKVSNESVSAERSSEGLIITIGDKTIIIYDNPETGIINSITINGNIVPVDDFGNAHISTDGVDISGSVVRIENSESVSVVPLQSIIERILEEISDVPQIIFRTWPGLQEG